MHVTETRRLARRHIKHTGRGSTIFNDRLVDGRRSLKVWGWNEQDYQGFQQVLNGAGFNSEIVCFPKRTFWSNTTKMQYRIHVDEK